MKPDEKSQGSNGAGGGQGQGNQGTPPGQTIPPGQAKPPKPPKSDEEVEEILTQTLPSEEGYLSLVREIFMSLLPTIYNRDVLSMDPTGNTRERLQQLRLHSQFAADSFLFGTSEIKTNYARVRGQQARKIKFFL